ncbi:MAG: translation initiation factor IF-2, partial [Candidatus Zixiibacteriota bacterium]
ISEEKPPVAPPVPQKTISANELTTTRELAQKLGIGPSELIKKALEMGSFLTINQRLDKGTIEILAQEYGAVVKFVEVFADEASRVEIDRSRLKIRPSVVTVMGHVNHGKTTLLDAIRQTAIAEKEYGGITQHIGASVVKTAKGEIVFLDTPGHQAFTAMRARGAKVTDIVILVVSAVDGVMPQTVEAINHARAAGVPTIVAINKIDVAGANPGGIKQELTKYNLIGEEWGGDTLMVEVSAKKRINLDKLLDLILVQAEMLELKADPECPASGTVIEARLDPRKGPVATVLLQQGTLKIGQYFIAGFSSGKVRAMFDFQHKRINTAGPSTPVEILGFETVPTVGDMFKVVAENLYREIAWQRQQTRRDLQSVQIRRATLSDLGKSTDKVLN